MPSRNADLLSRVEIFKNLSASELERVAQLMEERRYPEDTVIFTQGEPGDTLLIVLEGRGKVYLQDGQRETVLAFFGEGDVLGEMALLTGEPRSANAMALTDARVLTLSKEAFTVHLATNATVVREMARVMAMRQLQMGLRLGRGPDGAAEPPVEEGKVYVVFSPRGGSGKTTVAVNLAVTLAHQHPEQVGLVDLALTFSHCSLALNFAPKATLAAVGGEFLSKMDPEELKYFLTPHASSLKVLVAAGKPEEGEAVTGDLVRVALHGMKRIFGITVVDTDSTFSEATVAALETANKVILICAPELAMIRDVQECQRIFDEVIHLPKERVLYVMNSTVPFNPLTVDQFSEAVAERMHAEIPFGNDLPAVAAARGEALAQLFPQSDVATAIAAIARRLDGGPPTGDGAQAGRLAGAEVRGSLREAGPVPTSARAQFWKRAGASIIDGVVAGGAASAVAGLVTWVGLMLSVGALTAVGVGLGAVLVWLYSALMESSPVQATLGKELLGIMVTDRRGRRISFGRASLRFLAKIVSALPLGVGFWMAAFTPEKQALHDLIADSLVVNKR